VPILSDWAQAMRRAR